MRSRMGAGSGTYRLGCPISPSHLGISHSKNQAIAKGIPSVPAGLAMILVRVVASMRKDDVGLDAALENLEPPLDLLALGGKKAVLEVLHIDSGARGP